MIYQEDEIDLEAFTFEADAGHTCLVCGPWGVPGYVGKPKGGLRLCPACGGTCKAGAKLPSLPDGVYELPTKGREGFGGRQD